MIDCNTFIGNWAFRRLRNNDAAGLLRMMDQFGIERACPASADAIMYRDCHAGNEKLYEETRGHEDRLWLIATLNPAYAGWERDLRDCVDMGFKGLRLYPIYHQYDLGAPEAKALLNAAGEAGLPVMLPSRVVDPRQRHWMDVLDNLSAHVTVSAAERHPNTTFVILEDILPANPHSSIYDRMSKANVYVEMSRMTASLQKPLQVLVDTLGPERVLFGTGYPFKAASPALLKMQVLKADSNAKDAIMGGNAQRLFGG